MLQISFGKPYKLMYYQIQIQSIYMCIYIYIYYVFEIIPITLISVQNPLT